MSLQHSDFAEETASFVGSPELARRLLSSDACGVSAEKRANFCDAALFVGIHHEPFANRVTVDPVRHPVDLRLSVRCLPRTEARISAIAQAMDFTFWGQAVALVLGLAVARPAKYDMADLRASAPAGLLKARGTLKCGKALAPMLVRRIHSPVTRATAFEIDRIATRERVSRTAAAALILHRHAAPVAAMIAAR